MCEEMTDAQRFRKRIAAIFGEGAQTSLARFLALAGDKRPHKSILRSINGYANSEHALPGEIIAILTIIEHPERIPEMVRVARKEPPPPAFQLKPLPKVAAKKSM
jgi:hypothetical protein